MLNVNVIMMHVCEKVLA